jgi:hypothetical protein
MGNRVSLSHAQTLSGSADLLHVAPTCQTASQGVAISYNIHARLMEGY